MKYQPSNQMCDMDWVPYPASLVNSSSFHPDVLESSTENLMKLAWCTEEGAIIFWCPAGGEITSNFSTVSLVHTFQQTPEPDLFSLSMHVSWITAGFCPVLCPKTFRECEVCDGNRSQKQGMCEVVSDLPAVPVGLEKQWSWFWGY